jgi:hypothetical protein
MVISLAMMGGRASDKNARQYARPETEDIQEEEDGSDWRVWSRCWCDIRIESTSNGLRRVNLLAKRAGERSAGNLHAPFDVAGNGNQLTVRLVRHSQRKRRAMDRSNLRSMAPFLDPTTWN